MKVIEYRKPREGKKDKVWKKVVFSNQEWAIMMTCAALVAVLVSALNNMEYQTNVLGVIAFSLMMMAVFALVIWGVVSLWLIHKAIKEGTIVERTE